jgi:1-deoxy-D-xylulose-5-phosphate synthase
MDYREVKSKNIDGLNDISKKIRDRVLEVVSKNGGHLTSPLGAVELIVAMHYVFDSTKDPFIFDVSHQAYPHKLLTGRWSEFETLRTHKGISGFTKPKESEFDYFVAGHSSTSISLAVGAAKSIKIKNEDRVPVVMIGDGSMSSGMIYEGLNELGHLKLPVVIILNDNEMSIAKPIGAISEHLSRLLAGEFCQRIKKSTEKMLSHLPESATYVAKRVEESLKLITPGLLFEEMGIDYIGPIDGHNYEDIIKTLKVAKNLNKPVIVHAQTIKGKGYPIAEGRHEQWHGVGPFNLETGVAIKSSSNSESATKVFSDALLNLAKVNDKVVGVTAAMPSGTGIDAVIKEFPNRFWDVAIAEEHAVTSMAASAKEGLKPFITIYSTFLQRAYDQIIHDCALMNLPVVFAIDRAGIVGADGETHQGAFDISYLRHIPNLTLFAPRDKKTLIDAVNFASTLKSPCAFRYPRGAFSEFGFEFKEFELGKAQLLKNGESKKLFIGYGAGVNRAFETLKLIDEDIALLDLRFVKPLDKTLLKELSIKHKEWYIFSDSAKMGGVGSAILEFLSEEEIYNIKLKSFEYSDNFIQHGDTKLIEEELGILPYQLAKKVTQN